MFRTFLSMLVMSLILILVLFFGLLFFKLNLLNRCYGLLCLGLLFFGLLIFEVLCLGLLLLPLLKLITRLFTLVLGLVCNFFLPIILARLAYSSYTLSPLLAFFFLFTIVAFFKFLLNYLFFLSYSLLGVLETCYKLLIKRINHLLLVKKPLSSQDYLTLLLYFF